MSGRKTSWGFVLSLGLCVNVHADAIRIDKMPPHLLRLGEYWSPYIVSPSHDPSSFPTRFDADGDWDLSNNAEKFEKGKFPIGDATIYFDAFETPQMTTLVYQIYTPFDPKKSDPHEHECEGVILSIEKQQDKPMGDLVLMLTRAHDFIIPYYAGRVLPLIPPFQDEFLLTSYMSILNNLALFHHDRREPIEFQDDEYGHHPMVLQGSTETGHGHYKFNLAYDHAQKDHSLTKNQVPLEPNKGMIYAYSDQPDNPLVVQSKRVVGYSLVPIIETLADADIRYNPEESEEYQERFSLSKHHHDFVPKDQIQLATFFDLPLYYKTSNPNHRKANPYWAWSDRGKYFGVDPVHYIQTNLRPLEKILNWKSNYLFNAYEVSNALAKSD